MSDFDGIFARVSYTGSPEHKRWPNPMCEPHYRSDASDCDAVDPELSRNPDKLLRWLREAIRRGQVDRVLEGEFPRKAWARVTVVGGQALLEFRLTNRAAGAYKGYFVEMDDFVGKAAWVAEKLQPGGQWSEVLP